MTSLLLEPSDAQAEGCQTPRFQVVPEFVSTAGQEAIDLAASVGLFLDPWQQLVMHGSLGERADGTWSATDVGLIVSRQNGKGSILEARELYGLFLAGERVMVHTAHQYRTADEAFRRIRTLIDGSDALTKRIKKISISPTGKSIETVTGQRLMFMARSSSGAGRGMTLDLVILDEAYQLPSDVMAAMLPTLSARPNRQVWYTSSAPYPHDASEMLRRVRRNGRASSSKRLAYFEWSAPEDADPADRTAWAQANPGLGIRISDDAVQSELETLGPEDFARERLGISPEDESARLITAAMWESCRVAEQPMLRPRLAIDVSPARVDSSISAAGFTTDGHLFVKVLAAGEGTEWVAAEARRLQLTHSTGPVGYVKGTSGESLLSALVEAGCDVVPVQPGEYAAACGDLLTRVTSVDERGLRHVGQAELDAAVANVSLRISGDKSVWDRKIKGTDITPLCAATTAAHLAVNPPPVKRPGAFMSF